ncbi:GDSL esterase/lipase At1g31550 isoform X2 [Beta vulgaris subsp. vulgaris]|uniref:GDSL esterase/lipase At1g31550 isoform X2 n=1 Tax=Beta vulgaris subsp. vulgaris TaxID=3555 RepID=UPI0020372AF5|nr:GDSL esterase/lipase At1g31550 isoform X2 [Beta vulgaris subsp. vulgaris]
MTHFLSHLRMLCLFFTSLCAPIVTPHSVGASLRIKETLNQAMEFEAIYQFGDSLSDTGNYVREHASSAYSRLPYGQTYYPTGRASDGLIMVDYFAIKERLQKSLVLMGEIGGNDFNGPFYQGKSIQEVCKLIPGVVKTIKDAIEEVISFGATNIVVPGNFPIGCVPLYLVKFATNDTSKYDELECLKDYNDFSKFYNQQLLQAIQQLQQVHPDVAIVYADYYSALISVIINAPQLGIEQDGTKKACCGAGNNPYNYGTKSCGSSGASVCEDPSKRINWDGVHMTQQGNIFVGEFLLQQFVPALQKHLRTRLREPRNLRDYLK